MGNRKFLRNLPQITAPFRGKVNPAPCRGGVKKGVILLSGGIDSATTLYLAKEKGYKLYALIFDYNQRHRKEIECAKKIAKLNRIKYRLLKLNLSWVKSSLTTRAIKVPLKRNLRKKAVPSTYVSGRNIIFLSYAASFAESIGVDKIFIGAHIQDYSNYPDCRPEFLQSLQKTINLGIKKKNIKIIAPLINQNKKQIIALGLKLGVAFAHTWSCYEGKKFPCGRCDSCRFRIEAFKELGVGDPLLRI